MRVTNNLHFYWTIICEAIFCVKYIGPVYGRPEVCWKIATAVGLTLSSLSLP